MNLLDSIPQSRLILYLLALGAAPILLALSMHWSKTRDGGQLLTQAAYLHDRALTVEVKRIPNRQVLEFYEDADPLYLHKHLEPLRFLEEEVEQLKAILALDTVGVNEAFQNRLEFLSNENRLDFGEGETRSLANVKETTHTSTRPIEVGQGDILKLLAYIEGVPIDDHEAPSGRPQLLITEWKVNRKKGVGDNEVFALTMRIIRREFTAQ